jgi:DNA repair exonuclease SbcCD ATPase subunit
MDSTSIIDYIKQTYPKVVFTPFKFQQSRALAFIISDNNLVIGFVNSNGSLCKLIEPVNLNILSSESMRSIIENIPIVKGFTDEDKTRLMKMFEYKEDTVTKTEHIKAIEELQQKLKQLQDSRPDIQNLVSELESSVSNLSGKNKDLETSLLELSEKNKTLESSIAELSSKNKDLESTISSLDKEKGDTTLESSILQLNTTISELSSKNKDLDSTVSELSSKNKDLDSTVSELSSKNKDLDSTLSELSSKNKDLDSTLSELSSKNKDLESTLSELTSKNKDLESTLSELTSKNRDLESTLSELTGKNSGLESSVSELSSKNKDLESTVSGLNTTISELSGKNQDVDSAFSNLNSIIAELTGKNKGLESSVSELKEKNSNLESSVLEYKTLYDGQSNQIVLIKKQYEDKIESITNQYNDALQQVNECRRQIVDQNQAILDGINKHKDSLKEFIASKDFKIEDLERIHLQDVEERHKLQQRLDDLLKSETSSLANLQSSGDQILDYEKRLEEGTKRVAQLTDAIDKINAELSAANEELKQSALQRDLLDGYKSRCKEKLLQEKDQVINAIKEYVKKWISWVEKSRVNVDEQKHKLLQEFELAKGNLQSVLEAELNKSNSSNKEVQRLKQNILDVETYLKKTINDQLTQLSIKDEIIKQKDQSISDMTSEKSKLERIVSEKGSNISEMQSEIDRLKETNKRIPELQKELEQVRGLLEKNRNTPIQTSIDYDNCYSIVTNFASLNNIFYRKQEIIKKLDDIITNNLGAFQNLSDTMKDSIKKDFERVKTEINNHIKFLNLADYIGSPNFEYLKSKSSRSRVPESYCKDLSNLLDYWEINKIEYREQDMRLTNIYEDLAGAVRIYIRVKPLLGDEKTKSTIELQTIENKRTKSLYVDCSSVPNTKYKNRSSFGDFYGIFEDDFTNVDVYTGQRGTVSGASDNTLQINTNDIIESSESISPGLYTTFKQVQDGYSVVIFGYGLSGSGKCHGRGTEILMYDGSIKKVEDIKEGDLLMGDDSTPRKILSLARGKDMMYEIINSKGDKYIVNSEHILTLKYTGKKYLRDRKDRLAYQVCYFDKNSLSIKTKNFSYKEKDKIEIYDIAKKYLDELIEDLIVDIPLKKYMNISKGYKSQLRGFKVPIEFNESSIDLDPYMLGVWLGDGHKNTSEITNQDATILKYFRDNLPKYNCYLSFQNSSTYHYRICSNDKSKYHEHSNYFVKKLHSYNLLNNKHIPHIYKCNSRKNRLQLLAGIIDSDGHLDKNGGYEICQSKDHENLINDIIYLVRSLGFSCYKNIKKTSWTYNNEYKTGEAWRIHIYGNGIEEIPVLCKRKKSNCRKQIKDPLVSSISIKQLKEDDYYGFELDGNHRYVLGNFIVTHNTWTLLGSKGNPGILHYGLANLENVKNIRLKYLFEQYYDKINYNNRQVSGRIHNLVGKIPQLNDLSIDETIQFEKRIPSFINIKSLRVEDIYGLTDMIDEYRIDKKRIKQTPNNPYSSRSHLYFVFEIEFTNGKRGFVTIVDTAGRESPLDIFNTFIDTTYTSLASVMAPPPVGGVVNITKNLKPQYKDTYTPEQVFDILNEGFYINETINHLIYYFNLKNGKTIETPKQKIDKRYNVVYKVQNYFVQPQDETNQIDGNNNSLMIPVLKFLDNLSSRGKEANQDWKPTKFITICCVRQEAKYCDQTMETIQFAQNVKSS